MARERNTHTAWTYISVHSGAFVQKAARVSADPIDIAALKSQRQAVISAAIRYARMGWPVLPSQGKNPGVAGPNWQTTATSDELTIRRWYATTSANNVGVLTGDKFFVLDIDKKHGGYESLEELTRKHGRLPDTLQQISGGGGRHYFFAMPPNETVRSVKLLPGLETKGHHGFIVLEPSVHPESGKRYVFDAAAEIEHQPILPAPEWLLDLIRRGGKQTQTVLPDVIPHGQQHFHLVSLAGSLRGRGANAAEILAALIAANKRCERPADESYLRQTAESMMQYPPGRAGEAEAKLKREQDIQQIRAEPPPIDSYAPRETGEKLSPNDIGRMILEKHILLRDQQGYSYEYNGRYWEPVSSWQIEAYANQIDTHEHTARRRRAEAADYALIRSHIREIPWRQLKPFEVPTHHGVVNVSTGDLRPHRKTDYLEFVIPHRWPGKQAIPLFLAALQRYFGQDADCAAKISALQEFFGYCLMPHARYKKALLLHGETDTGKSIIPGILARLVGRKHVCSVSVEDMDDPRKREPLIGKALNILTELTAKSVVADGGFKTLVSTEEPLLIDPKFKSPILYTPIAKHVICTNNLPAIRDTSKAVYNRLLLIKFNHPIPKSEQDMGFEAKLADETEGILYWAMAGAARLYASGGRFTEIPESRDALEEYRRSQNPIFDFIAEKCYVTDDPDAEGISTKDFRDRYSEWLKDRVSPNKLAAQLRAAGHEIKQIKSGDTRVRRVPNLAWAALA